MKKIININKLLLSSLFLAIGIILPFFTAQIKEIGDTLLPMHIPVLLCGLMCGWKYGLTVGFMLPILRSVMFSMPPLYPNSIWMAFELAAYGFFIGLLYSLSKNKSLKYIYFCLISSMILGRIVWGIVKAVLLGAAGKSFTFIAFLTGGFVDSLLGIILQLILIPLILKINLIVKKKIS